MAVKTLWSRSNFQMVRFISGHKLHALFGYGVKIRQFHYFDLTLK